MVEVEAKRCAHSDFALFQRCKAYRFDPKAQPVGRAWFRHSCEDVVGFYGVKTVQRGSGIMIYTCKGLGSVGSERSPMGLQVSRSWTMDGDIELGIAQDIPQK